MKKQAFNPYLPSYEYIPDGEPHVFGDRVYIFGSHDRFGGRTFSMNDYVTWSAPVTDLSDWRYEGVIFKKTDDPYNRPVKSLYAPDVCQGLDGRYYLYFGPSTGLTRKTWVIRVAVADAPAGPYKYYGEVDLSRWSKEYLPFDPAVYVENGRVLLYYGSGMFYPMLDVSKKTVMGGAVVELEPDMVTVKSGPRLTVPIKGKDKTGEYGEHPFFEASSVRKFGDKYYFIYSSLLGHELCYAISDKPDGDWRFGGTIISIGNIGLNGNTDPVNSENYTGNTHGSIEEINGRYYVFYHRHTNGLQFARQSCADEVFIEPDGSIKQIEPTSCGLNGGPLRAKGTYEARIACVLKSPKGCKFYGVFREPYSIHPYFTQTGKDREEKGDQYIKNMRNGAVAGFRYFEFDGTETKISVKGRGKGSFTVTDGKNTVAAVPVGGSAELKISAGVHLLFFTYNGSDAADFICFTIG